MNATESQMRKDLSDCYRLFDWMEWTELIFNHITLRLPDELGKKSGYLINKFGSHYAEMTADENQNEWKRDQACPKKGQADQSI